jgi:type VI secretion system FHA domain protein
VSSGWAPSARAPDLPVASAWEPHVAKADPASAWSSAVPDRPAAPTPDDIWGKISDGNVVDWARGGFGQPIVENSDPLGLNKAPAQDSLPKAAPQMVQFGSDAWGAPAAPAAPGGAWANANPTTPTQPPPPPPPAAAKTAPTPSPSPPSAPAPDTGALSAALVQAFASAAGLKPGQVADLSPALLDRAGQLFRKLVAGLVVMVEARARAKSQMGAESTSFEFDGNNPIKFARTPEEAIAQLLNPPARGFMEAGRAIEDSYFDLQSHQMATLKAMQGALKATLDRFSPTAIRQRADSGGMLAKILPAARDAALWQAYEKEFGGVAQGSDEAFMDMFAKEFRKAYDEQAQRQRRR